MNLLYLSFVPDSSLYLGVMNKIKGQCHALGQLGFNVTYSYIDDGKLIFKGSHKASFKINPVKRVIKSCCAASREYIFRFPPDIVYFRIDRMSAAVMSVLNTAKKLKIKVVLEIPNYPYIKDYLKAPLKLSGLKNKLVTFTKALIIAAEDRIFGLKLPGKADAAILFGNHAESYFGIPAKNFDNGINTSAFPPAHLSKGNDIRFVSACGTIWWQGYERLLEGMRNYLDENKTNARNVTFTLIGGDKSELPEFKRLVASYNLQDRVFFTGFKTGKELEEIYLNSHIGVSTLGCYKRGLIYCSSLKSREYMALGLPFIYAYEDPLIEKRPFAKKFPNDSSPIDIGSVIEFYDSIAANPRILSEEREYAKLNFDWSVIMKNIMEFAVPELLEGDKTRCPK